MAFWCLVLAQILLVDMTSFPRFYAILLSLLLMTTALTTHAGRAENAANRVLPALERDAKGLNLQVGAPVFIRIFKHDAVLELWLKGAQRYALFRSYPICAYSGGLGPKTMEGDGQAPEGIYQVSLKQMNPASRFHLSFNLGYPNAYDQAHGYTGSALMVHGNCVSIGCYAMTDAKIEEIYTLMARAFVAGQASIPVHAFPFRLTKDALVENSKQPFIDFWQELAPIYQAFEDDSMPPKVRVQGGHYRIVE